MLTGATPSPQAARTLDAALIVHADHEMNASTFAARVVASTLAGLHAALTAALGALGGALHGGANERVMQLLEEVGTPERAAATVEARLQAGRARDRLRPPRLPRPRSRARSSCATS